MDKSSFAALAADQTTMSAGILGVVFDECPAENYAFNFGSRNHPLGMSHLPNGVRQKESFLLAGNVHLVDDVRLGHCKRTLPSSPHRWSDGAPVRSGGWSKVSA